MNAWNLWKSGFDRWEKTSAEYLDKLLQNPSVLGPSATLLGVLMQAKGSTRQLKNKGFRAFGLTSRDEQERALHRINQLESQVLDLQEELEQIRESR